MLKMNQLGPKPQDGDGTTGGWNVDSMRSFWQKTAPRREEVATAWGVGVGDEFTATRRFRPGADVYRASLTSHPFHRERELGIRQGLPCSCGAFPE